MSVLAAIVLASIFIILSGIHVYWAFGGAWGIDVALPEPGNVTLKPTVWMTFTVAVGLLLFAVISLISGKFFTISNYPTITSISTTILYGIGLIFFVRAIGDFKYVGFLKTNNKTKFAYYDTRIYSPLCLLIVLLTIFILYF